MYNPRQPHITSGVNGGRFASYGQPHASSTPSAPRVGHSRDRRTAGQGKATPKRKGESAKKRSIPTAMRKHLSISQRAKAKSRTTSRAAFGGRKKRKR